MSKSIELLGTDCVKLFLRFKCKSRAQLVASVVPPDLDALSFGKIPLT